MLREKTDVFGPVTRSWCFSLLLHCTCVSFVHILLYCWRDAVCARANVFKISCIRSFCSLISLCTLQLVNCVCVPFPHSVHPKRKLRIKNIKQWTPVQHALRTHISNLGEGNEKKINTQIPFIKLFFNHRNAKRFSFQWNHVITLDQMRHNFAA